MAVTPLNKTRGKSCKIKENESDDRLMAKIY